MRGMAPYYLLLACNLAWFAQAQDTGETTPLGQSDPAIEQQLRRTYNAILAAQGNDPRSDCEAFQQIQKLKDVSRDKGAIVRQLAIFVATTTSEEDVHVIHALALMQYLDLPPSSSIRVLAPCLDADNRKLRDFARIWFANHDTSRSHGAEPLRSVDYWEYMKYIRQRIARNEEIPHGFAEYIFEKAPDRALLAFLTATGQGVGPNEVAWGEHVVRDALWLREHGFADQYQKALPDAKGELSKLAGHSDWWVRLYVAEIMRRHASFRDPDVVKKLAGDAHPTVAKVAKKPPLPEKRIDTTPRPKSNPYEQLKKIHDKLNPNRR